MDIYANALNDDVGASTTEIQDINDFYEVYDGICDQQCKVAQVDGRVVGVASFDLERTPPFFEGVAVDSEMRDGGIAKTLLLAVLKEAREKGITEIHSRSQPSALEINRKLLERCGFPYVIDASQKYPLIHIYIS